MVRNYSDRPVDTAVVERVLANALHAPSAGFTQGWAFLLLDTPDDVARFWEACTPPEAADEPDSWLRGMRTAPVVVVPLSNKGTSITFPSCSTSTRSSAARCCSRRTRAGIRS